MNYVFVIILIFTQLRLFILFLLSGAKVRGLGTLDTGHLRFEYGCYPC